MEVPKNTVDLAMTFEGLYLKPYLCPAGIPTQGYGHIVKSLSVPPVTKEQAEVWLALDLQDALVGTLRACPILVTTPPTWLGSIVDFVFNLGVGRLASSTLRRKINAEEWDDVPYQLSRWVYGGGRILRGLVLRREAEAFYFI
jgi:lysozyme